MDARKAIERILGSKVYLDLHVDVREGWTRNKRILKELGYVVVKE
jgi:GTP-binding protein Era